LTCLRSTGSPESEGEPSESPGPSVRLPADDTVAEGDPSVITFPEASWDAASLPVEPASIGLVEQATTVTGKVTLSRLGNLSNRTVRFQSDAWPGETFEGTVFYAGDVVGGKPARSTCG